MRIFPSMIGILLCAASFAGGQPVTRVGAHRVGETVQEWLAVNRLDIAEICGKHPRGDRRMDFKAVCGRLSWIRDTGQGEFVVGDVSTRQAFTWRFREGRLAGVVAEYALPDVERQVKLLTEAYGEPATNRIVRCGSYGGDCAKVWWDMPDGTVILLREEIQSPLSGETLWFTVSFFSKDYLDALVQDRDLRPNPYSSR